MPDSATSTRRSNSLIVVAAVAAALIALFVTGGAFVLGQQGRIPLTANSAIADVEWQVEAPQDWDPLSSNGPDSETWQLPDRHYLRIAGGEIEDFDASAYLDDAVDSGITDPENDEQATQKFAWESLGLSPNATHHATKLDSVTLTLSDAEARPLDVEFALFEVETETEHVLVAVHVFNASDHLLMLAHGAEDDVVLDAQTLIDDLEHIEITLTSAS